MFCQQPSEDLGGRSCRRSNSVWRTLKGAPMRGILRIRGIVFHIETCMFGNVCVMNDEVQTRSGALNSASILPKLFPLHLSGCADFMSSQVFAQSAGQIMIEQNFHG